MIVAWRDKMAKVIITKEKVVKETVKELHNPKISFELNVATMKMNVVVTHEVGDRGEARQVTEVLEPNWRSVYGFFGEEIGNKILHKFDFNRHERDWDPHYNYMKDLS